MANLPSQPGLGDLIDLEFHLLADANPEADDACSKRIASVSKKVGAEWVAEEGLAAQDARRLLETDRGKRWQICAAWLHQLRSSGAASPGEGMEKSLRISGGLLSALGLLLGGSAAAASLAYDGNAPVNLWQFLAVFVVLQIVLLAVLLVAVGTSVFRGRAWISSLQRLVSGLASTSIVQRMAAAGSSQGMREAWSKLANSSSRLSARRPLYQDSERWLLFQLSQRFGLFFNLGAVLIFAWMVMFSDLAFGWSTTPANVDASFLASLVSWIALPWAWLFPQWVPDLTAVESTRWNRLDSAFVGADPEIAAVFASEWWAFLFLALICWGLLPRLIAWLWAGRNFRQSLRKVQLDHAAFQGLYDRMLPNTTGQWQHPNPKSVQGKLLPKPGGDLSGSALAQGSSKSSDGPHSTNETSANLCIWGGWNLAEAQSNDLIQARFGWAVHRTHLCGGANEADETTALKALAMNPSTTVLLLAEGGESPDKRLLRFLSEVRTKLDEGVSLVVGLVEPDGENWAPVSKRQLELWRRFLGTLKDPYLRVEALT